MEHHTLEAVPVPKSQPLEHNDERALTPTIHCQIWLAIAVWPGVKREERGERHFWRIFV